MKEKIVKYFKATLNIIFVVGFLVLLYTSSIFIIKNISDTLAKDILEYIRVLAWPVVAFTAIFLFKTDISGFLHRLIKGKHPLIGEWEASPVEAQEKGEVTQEIIQPASEAFNQIVFQKEAEINALENTKQQLTNTLTKAQIELDFERIYNYIFSNQIDLLNQINNLGGEVAFEFIAEHFAKVQQTFSVLQEWNPVKYLEFLVNNQLIEYRTTVGNFISAAISLKGKAFSAYITARNYKKYGL